MIRITMLMPNLPHVVCGIADHSLLMGKALNRLGCDVDYLARHGDGSRIEAPNLHVWDGRAASLVDAIRLAGTQVLWVQYSGYGFSGNGAPLALASALGHVRKLDSAPMIVVCMHETHADLSRFGWRGILLQRLQRTAARRVARSGDLVFATVDISMKRCVHEYGVSPELVFLLPIATNIPWVSVGQGDRIALRRRLRVAAEARIAAAFGRWDTQSRALALFERDLRAALRGGLIDHVVAVGGEAAEPPGDSLTCLGGSLNGQLTVLGPASEREIAKILRCCDVGLVPTPLDYVRKSGVAAAFATAELELWMKNEQSELVVEKNPEPFPDWNDLAVLASEKMSSCWSRREHGEPSR
jgi:hypothetical protein